MGDDGACLRVLNVDSEYGKVDLDQSRAIIENPVVDIDLQLRFSKAKIPLPAQNKPMSTWSNCSPYGLIDIKAMLPLSRARCAAVDTLYPVQQLSHVGPQQD